MARHINGLTKHDFTWNGDMNVSFFLYSHWPQRGER
jgi:hypothetical protein